MNRTVISHSIRFVVLILLQGLIFSHINFLGFLNPYVYIIFILLLPITTSRSLFLVLSFVLGLCVDMFGDSGGVHAAACVVIAYIRPAVLSWVFGLSYEFQTVRFTKISVGEQLIYVSILTLIHHLILFVLESFSFGYILLIIKKVLFSSLFSIMFIMLILVLLRKKDS